MNGWTFSQNPRKWGKSHQKSQHGHKLQTMMLTMMIMMTAWSHASDDDADDDDSGDDYDDRMVTSFRRWCWQWRKWWRLWWQYGHKLQLMMMMTMILVVMMMMVLAMIMIVVVLVIMRSVMIIVPVSFWVQWNASVQAYVCVNTILLVSLKDCEMCKQPMAACWCKHDDLGKLMHRPVISISFIMKNWIHEAPSLPPCATPTFSDVLCCAWCSGYVTRRARSRRLSGAAPVNTRCCTAMTLPTPHSPLHPSSRSTRMTPLTSTSTEWTLLWQIGCVNPQPTPLAQGQHLWLLHWLNELLSQFIFCNAPKSSTIARSTRTNLFNFCEDWM